MGVVMAFDRKAWQKAYRSTEEFKAKRRATRNLEKNRISCRKYYAENYDKISVKNKKYYVRPEIIERYKQIKKQDYIKNGIERGRKKIVNVELKYVRELLKKDGSLKNVAIPIELLEAKRLQILIKRELNK
jgi:DNA topoisomerase IB